MAKLAEHSASTPSSKYAHTEYNRFNRVSGRMKSAYADAISFHSPQSTVLADLAQVYTSKDYKRLSSYYLGKFAGIAEMLFHGLYSMHGNDKPLLMFINVGKDGRIFPEYSDEWLTEDYEYKSTMVCQHIWRAPWDKDRTVRPW